MPNDPQKTGSSFSRLKELMGKISPKAISSAVSKPIQAFKSQNQQNELAKGISLIDKRNAALDQKQIQTEDLVKNTKIEALKKIYATMQSMGVDPSSLESIAQFRDKLTKEDPDLAELFFSAFDALTSGLEEPTTPPAPPDLMGQATTNLQEQPGMMR